MQDPDEIEEAGDLEEAEGSKRSYKKIILLAGIVIVILAGAGAGVYFTVGLGFLGISEEPAEEVAGEEGNKVDDDDDDYGERKLGKAMVKFDPFLVNLADPKRRRYLRTTFSLSLLNEEDKKDIGESIPRIRDAVLMLLSSKMTQELLTAEGKMRLHEEIVDQVNTVLEKEVAVDVFFTDFIIQ